MTVRAGREFLAIPGPTTMPDEVLQAMHRPALDIYSEQMLELTDSLLADLSKLFATKGFHGTGIRDLAQEADLSSASLYHYMGTKEDLLAEIMHTALNRLLDAAQPPAAGMIVSAQAQLDVAATPVLIGAPALVGHGLLAEPIVG